MWMGSENMSVLNAALMLDVDSTSSVTLTSRGGLLGAFVTNAAFSSLHPRAPREEHGWTPHWCWMSTRLRA
jgi:hypothetical protein